MKTFRPLLLVTALAIGLLVVPSSATANVVLGSKAFAPNGAGWGTAHPKSIFNGGDPSGSVRNIHWKHWGQPVAIAHGLNPIFKPGGGYYSKPGRIKLRADRIIQNCNGHRAYSRLMARFPKYPGGALGPWQLWAGASTLCGGIV